MEDWPCKMPEKIAQNDPWIHLNATSGTSASRSPENFIVAIDSERYIAGLEAKLNRLKGRTGKEPTSQDIMRNVSLAKDAQMTAIASGSYGPYVSDYADETCTDTSSVMSDLQRRLNPEKQALNPEELKWLIDNDELSKTSTIADDGSTTTVDTNTLARQKNCPEIT